MKPLTANQIDTLASYARTLGIHACIDRSYETQRDKMRTITDFLGWTKSASANDCEIILHSFYRGYIDECRKRGIPQTDVVLD